MLFAIRSTITGAYVGADLSRQRHVAYARKFATMADLTVFALDHKLCLVLACEVDPDQLEASAARIATRFRARLEPTAVAPHEANGHAEPKTMGVAS